MKKLLASLLLLTTTLAAQCCPDGYFAGGEALFLKPCTEDLYFTIRGPTVPNNDPPTGTEFAIKPDYDVGYAVWGGLTTCEGKGMSGNYSQNFYLGASVSY